MKKTVVAVTKIIAMILAWLLSPQFIAVLSFLLACGLLTYGVHLLYGLGWAMLACSVPFFVLSAVLIRGLARG